MRGKQRDVNLAAHHGDAACSQQSAPELAGAPGRDTCPRHTRTPRPRQSPQTWREEARVASNNSVSAARPAVLSTWGSVAEAPKHNTVGSTHPSKQPHTVSFAQLPSVMTRCPARVASDDKEHALIRVKDNAPVKGRVGELLRRLQRATEDAQLSHGDAKRMVTDRRRCTQCVRGT